MLSIEINKKTSQSFCFDCWMAARFVGRDLVASKCRCCSVCAAVTDAVSPKRASCPSSHPAATCEDDLGAAGIDLNAYFQSTAIHEDIEDWCCLNAPCLDTGRAEDPPRLGIIIDVWPDTLLLSLKRWDSIHGLHRQAILCDNVLLGTSTSSKPSSRTSATCPPKAIMLHTVAAEISTRSSMTTEYLAQKLASRISRRRQARMSTS